MKRCRSCKETKGVTEFSRMRLAKDGLQYDCKACNKAYRVANADRKKAYQHIYYRANREKLIAYWAEYREKYPEKVIAAQRAAYARDPEKHRAYSRRYRKENPEVVRQLNEKRRSLERGAQVSERINRRVVWEREGGRCHICDKHVPYKRATLDHLIPLSKGGDHTYLNVRIAHGPCNSRRGAGRLPAQLLLVA